MAIDSRFFTFAYGRTFFSIEGKNAIESELCRLMKQNLPMYALKFGSYIGLCDIEELLDVARHSDCMEPVFRLAWYQLLCTVSNRIKAEETQAYTELHRHGEI